MNTLVQAGSEADVVAQRAEAARQRQFLTFRLGGELFAILSARFGQPAGAVTRRVQGGGNASIWKLS